LGSPGDDSPVGTGSGPGNPPGTGPGSNGAGTENNGSGNPGALLASGQADGQVKAGLPSKAADY
jgi:hypothetical protein